MTESRTSSHLCRPLLMTRRRQVLATAAQPPMTGTFCLLILLLVSSAGVAADTADQLDDLTASVTPIVTLKQRDNFANEYRYEVVVENHTSRPVKTDSLVLVLESIIDLAGKDATNRIEVVDADGTTAEGKPYYKVPVEGAQLPAFSESEPATVRLRNPYYVVMFTPSFRVFGKQIREPRLPPAAPPQPKLQPGDVNRLVDLLIKKGIITQEDLSELLAPSGAPP